MEVHGRQIYSGEVGRVKVAARSACVASAPPEPKACVASAPPEPEARVASAPLKLQARVASAPLKPEARDLLNLSPEVPVITYPLVFNVSAEAAAGINAPWSTRAPSTDGPIPLSIPPEFEGPGGGFSPEDLFAAALANCFVATFKVFAEKSKLTYSDLKVDAKLAVDRDDRGRPWMARVDFDVRLAGTERVDLAQRLLERVSQNCMILNSVLTEKTFAFHISA